MRKNSLQEIQNWYRSQCDGNWEHNFGVKISTLDNPGWRIEFDLGETNLVDKIFKTIDIERNEKDWFRCWTDKNKFEGAGGPENLEEMLVIFLSFAGSRNMH